MLEDVKLVKLLLCSRGGDLSALQGVYVEHASHLLLFQVIDACLGESGLLLDLCQVIFDVVKVFESDAELIEILGDFPP